MRRKQRKSLQGSRFGCDPNYHKIRWTFALNFIKKREAISNTRKSVSPDIQTMRSLSHFQPTSQWISNQTLFLVPWLKMIIWLTGVLRRTVVGDWPFDNLRGSLAVFRIILRVWFMMISSKKAKLRKSDDEIRSLKFRCPNCFQERSKWCNL